VDSNTIGNFCSEFPQHGAWLTNHAGAVGAAFVPYWRNAQEIALIARADHADHDIMLARRIFGSNKLRCGQTPRGDPVVMLVDDWVEALGFGSPYTGLVFRGQAILF